MKSSKQKQKLYNNREQKEIEVIYNTYKNLLEDLFGNLFTKYKNDIKNTWKNIGELISNTKNKRKDIPQELVINNATVVAKQEIAENPN